MRPEHKGPKGPKQHQHLHKRKKLGASIGLDKFASAKKTGYDKRAKQEKERALNAAKVNAYRKLQKRLGDKLEPKMRLGQMEEEEEEGGQRAAPPQRVHQDQAARRDQQQLLHHKQQRVDDEDIEQQKEQQEEYQQQHDSQRAQQQQPRGQGEQWHGRQQHDGKHDRQGGGKRHKPLSHMQRIAAEVQEQKEAEQREREERRQAAEARAAKLAAEAKQRAAKNKILRKKTSHGQPVMKYRMEKLLSQLQAGQS